VYNKGEGMADKFHLFRVFTPGVNTKSTGVFSGKRFIKIVELGPKTGATERNQKCDTVLKKDDREG
jgi:hypothetical protein